MSNVVGEERPVHLMRTKSLPSSVVVVWPSVASSCCGSEASSGASAE